MAGAAATVSNQSHVVVSSFMAGAAATTFLNFIVSSQSHVGTHAISPTAAPAAAADVAAAAGAAV